MLNSVYLKFENPALNYSTSVSKQSTFESVTKYFLGSVINLGRVEDNLHKCIGLKFIERIKVGDSEESIRLYYLSTLSDGTIRLCDSLGFAFRGTGADADHVIDSDGILKRYGRGPDGGFGFFEVKNIGIVEIIKTAEL